ncbi:hypothetical protein [Brevifollis gellanilyticus]|nr:hypothetical protein [Brevifollis gellanilyticus]
MKLPFRFVLLVVLTCLQALSSLYGINPDDQPRMRKAIEHLEAAKTAEKPLASLQAARKTLANARPNKEGERIDALGEVKEAIAYATTGDKPKMIEKIDKALGKIRSGIARSR